MEGAEVVFIPGTWPKAAPPLQDGALCFSPKHGQVFDQGPTPLAVVRNRWELNAPGRIGRAQGA